MNILKLNFMGQLINNNEKIIIIPDVDDLGLNNGPCGPWSLSNKIKSQADVLEIYKDPYDNNLSPI